MFESSWSDEAADDLGFGAESALLPSPPAAPSDGPPAGSGAAADLGYAAHFVDGAGSALPHGETIAAAFGPAFGGALAGIQAHVGGDAADACDALGAEAFASGQGVAFRAPPDLHTAAHEAAHVVQQARGVNLYGGIGEAGDAYERHADAVADRVVAGGSAADLLGAFAGGGQAGGAVIQRKERADAPAPAAPTRMAAAQDKGEAASGAALDTELKLAAKKLADQLPALAGPAKDVEMLNGEIAEKRDEYLKLKRRIQRIDESGGDEYDQANARNEKRRLARRRDELMQELQFLDGRKHSEIAGVRDRVLRKALRAAEKEVRATFDKAKALSLGKDEISILDGADYVSHALAQARELTAGLEMAGNQIDSLTGKPSFGGAPQVALGELTALEGAVAEMRAAFGIERANKPLEIDLDKDLDALEGEAVGQHLDAAVAQAEYVGQALDAWHAKGPRAAEGIFNDLVASVEAIDTHLSDAAQRLEGMDAGEKKKFQARLGGVRRAVQRVWAKGHTRQGGGTPASASVTIDLLPERLSQLGKAAGGARK